MNEWYKSSSDIPKKGNTSQTHYQQNLVFTKHPQIRPYEQTLKYKGESEVLQYFGMCMLVARI